MKKLITILSGLLIVTNLNSQEFVYKGLEKVEATIGMNKNEENNLSCLDVENYNGNVSLQNKNIKSITAKNTYNLDSPYSINDGYLSLLEDGYPNYDNQKVKRGTWLSTTNNNNWIEIEFIKPVTISSYNIYPRKTSNYENRMMKDYYFSYSKNYGESYTDLKLKTVPDKGLEPYNNDFVNTLECVTNVKINIINNFGSGYLQITELELIQ